MINPLSSIIFPSGLWLPGSEGSLTHRAAYPISSTHQTNRKMKPDQNQKAHQSLLLNPSTHLRVALLALIVVFLNTSLSAAQDLRLFRTPKDGNTLKLTKRAMITSVNKSKETANYTIWRNGKAYISITQKHNIQGILPAGTYVLKVDPGASVTIKLSTTIKPQKLTLWGRKNKIVKPLDQGNKVVLTQATTITDATYEGTEGFSISAVQPNTHPTRVLYFISPHKRGGNGPKVIGGTGGKTMVGQTLPAGVYLLTPGQGTADGIVSASVVLSIK